MRLAWSAAAAVLLLGGVAQADQPADAQPNAPAEDQLSIGVGMICNTSEQVQRFVRLRADGAETERALNVVNEEAKNPRACGVAAVAFMPDKAVDVKNVQGKLVSIVRINIVAAFDGQRWARVPVMTQYALMQPAGYDI